MTPDDRLDALTDSVSEGRREDWDALASGASDPRQRGSIRALGQLSRIADFHRALQRGANDADAGAAGPQHWGELLLLEQVGAGTRGDVWRAWDPRLQREVALKLLRVPTGALGEAPLRDEARALARVRHPNVVTVHGIAAHDGRAGVWMEYLHGDTLAAAIGRGPLAPAEVARIGAALAGALAAVHSAGVVHRDLKPANVVLAGDGRVVLTDFGLGVRGFEEDAGPQRVSGTPMFMSPERLEGAPASATSDLYALGVTLRWALTGAAPFAAQTLEALRAEARRGPTRSLAAARSDAPPELVRAIDRAMAPDPHDRFATAADAQHALESATPPAAAPRSGVGAAVRIVGAVVLAAAALAAWRAWDHRHDGPRVPAASHAGRVAAPPAGGMGTAAYDVEAALVRRTGGRYQRLAPGDRVHPGDQLSLEFHATRPAWVYVLDEDERGESYLLFPQPRFDARNPIANDSTVVLPGRSAGHEQAWTVTSRGGREHFLVIATPAPLTDLDRRLATLPRAEPGRPIRYATVPAPALDRLRGVGGVSDVAPVRPARGDVFEQFRTLSSREFGVRGVWVRQITLENPLR